MKRRNGITLIEVLVTIFVMAIGLLAVLCLFPLAALNMAQSMVDDRVGHCAANAFAIANMYPDFRPSNDAAGGTASLFYGGPAGYVGPPANDNAPSSPVYIDPYGMQNGPTVGNAGNITRLGMPWLKPVPTGQTPTNLPAMPVPSAALLNQFYTQTFVLQDDLYFNPDGTAQSTVNNGVPTPNTLMREGRFSWAYLLRRPASVSAGVVDVTVVVYHQRSVYKNAAGSPETPVQVSNAVQGGNAITITPPAGATLRKGVWLLDITQSGGVYGPVNAFFYRVMNVSLAGSGQMQLEIQPAIKTPTMTNAVLMENVVNVFERGPGSKMPYMRADE